MGLPAVTVAIDGSVYERHPKFHGYMMEILANSRFSSNTQVRQWRCVSLDTGETMALCVTRRR